MDPTQSNGIGLPCGAFGQCVTVLNSTAGYSCQCTSNLNGTNCTECKTIHNGLFINDYIVWLIS